MLVNSVGGFALLFLLMGSSGFFLNHRAQLKIDTGQPYEVSAMDIAVRPGQFADADALGHWAKTTLGMAGEAREPRGEGPPDRRARKPMFLGKALPEAMKWTRQFTLVDGRVTVDHVPGSASVSVKREGQGILNSIKNLHKGVGLGMVWRHSEATRAGQPADQSLIWTFRLTH